MASVEVAGDVFVAPTEEGLVESSARWILAHLQSVFARQERCSIALSGGSTPGPVYRKLAEAGSAGEYDGSRLDLCLADERCVPADHVDANARLVQEQWLAFDARPRLIIPRAESSDWAEEAQHYANALPTPIDLVVLGIGPDGHTASLFPGASTLTETQDQVIYVNDSPKPPPHRWSLSVRALREARALVTIVSGSGKAEALARAIDGEWAPDKTPAQFARRGTWFVDASAATQLSSARLNR